MEPIQAAGEAQQLRPICFMVMPFGIKDTLAPPERKAPAKINFNSLWEKAYAPAIRALGYDAIRADEDSGALIIHEMIERLAISDLVIADLTIPNANVYYEIGIRHTARASGCVLLSADWAVPLFDVNQLRRITFPLPDENVSDETAAVIGEALKAGIPGLRDGKTPPYSVLNNFPAELTADRAQVFKDLIQRLATFQAEVTAVRNAPKDQCAARAKALAQRYSGDAPMLSSVAMELLFLLRDCGSDWRAVVDYVDRLPKVVRDLPTVQEQRALGLAKLGSPLEAAAVLETMIATLGPTSEREGMLGGRYKELYLEAREKGTPDEARYLDLAIEHYDLGMKLDLNDYYPTCNLPRLLRRRDEEGDEERAKAAAFVTLVACERAKAKDPKNAWLNQTLLGAAFDAGDAVAAERLYRQILKENVAVWKLDTTLKDLKLSVELQPDATTKEKLTATLGKLRALLPPPA